MNQGRQPSPPSSDATRPPTVGGDLLNALDAALVAAWEDDPLIAAFCHNDELVGAVADLEFAIEMVRAALARLSPPNRAASDRNPS